MCRGESEREQHIAQMYSYAHRQTGVGSLAHTHTQEDKTKGRQSLLFACVKMSQGGDKRIHKVATESSDTTSVCCKSWNKTWCSQSEALLFIQAHRKWCRRPFSGGLLVGGRDQKQPLILELPFGGDFGC